MNAKFYVGLGSRYDSRVGWGYLIGRESGSIWRIEDRAFARVHQVNVEQIKL
jgi:hypothetical protein